MDVAIKLRGIGTEESSLQLVSSYCSGGGLRDRGQVTLGNIVNIIGNVQRLPLKKKQSPTKEEKTWHGRWG